MRVNTNSSSFIRLLLLGLQCGSGRDSFKVAFAALRPSTLFIFVYKLETSRVARMVLVGSVPNLLRICSRWVVSFMNDLSWVVGGFKKWSTKLEIFSVGPSLPETIGRPFRGVLCILGMV